MNALPEVDTNRVFFVAFRHEIHPCLSLNSVALEFLHRRDVSSLDHRKRDYSQEEHEADALVNSPSFSGGHPIGRKQEKREM